MSWRRVRLPVPSFGLRDEVQIKLVEYNYRHIRINTSHSLLVCDRECVLVGTRFAVTHVADQIAWMASR